MFSCSIALQFISYQITALYKLNNNNQSQRLLHTEYLSYSEKFVCLNLARLIRFGGVYIQ